MTAISWKIGQSDVWTDAASWSPGMVPGSGDDVTIAVAPLVPTLPYTITLDGNASVHSVTQSQAASILFLDLGTLAVAGTYALSAGQLEMFDSTLQAQALVSGGGTIVINSSGTIANTTIDGPLQVAALNSYNFGALYLTGDSFVGTSGGGAGSLVLGSGIDAVLGSSPTFDNAGATLNGGTLTQSDGTLTLGSHATILANGNSQVGQQNASLLNRGLISAVGSGTSLVLEGGTVFNQGTLSVGSGASAFVEAGSVSNLGLFSVNAGGSLYIVATGPAGLTNTGSIAVAGGLLSLDTALTTSQLAVYPVTSGTLGISGSLDNSGATLRSGSGSSFAHLMLLGGTITGGTLVNSGSFSIGVPPYQAGSGPSELSGVTVEGPLNLASSGVTLDVANGLTATGVSGSGAGSIGITGAGATLTVLDNETLDNVTIALGSASDQNDDSDSLTCGTFGVASTLTLGAHVTVSALGYADTIAGTGGTAVISNQGTIDALSHVGGLSLTNVANSGLVAESNASTLSLRDIVNTGTIADAAGSLTVFGTLTNSGTISISGSAAAYSDYTGLTLNGLINSGLFSVSNGATANLGDYGSDWVNGGTLSISNALLTVGGAFTLAQIGHVQESAGGTLGLAGTLTNTGTLAVGAGSSLPTLALELGGAITGGDILDAGGSLLLRGGALYDTTYEGVLSLAAAGAQAEIGPGVSLTGTAGSGPGSIALTGVGSILTADSPSLLGSVTTLDNATVSIGAAGVGATLSAGGGYFQTLTLGPQLTIQQVGASATIVATAQSTLINDGHILAGQAGGTLSLVGSFVNAGTIAVSNGETLVLATAGLSNTGSFSVSNGVVDAVSTTIAELESIRLTNSQVAVTGTLAATGGTLSAGAGGTISTLKLAGDLVGGTVTLTGPGSSLVWGSTQALDHAVLDIGSGSDTYAAPALLSEAEVSPPAVQLGAHLTVQQTGTFATLGGQFGTFASAGIIGANFAHGQLALGGDRFTNTGTIGISNGDTVSATAGGLTNAGLIVVGAGSAFDLNLVDYFASGSLADESFTNTGTVMMAGGMLAELTDNGAFPKVPFLNAAGGTLVGAGVVASQIDNDGTIEARGGALNLVQQVAGTGALKVDAGAMLATGGVTAGQTAIFSGVGGVLGLTPPYFLGTIGGFASGDTIDLFNTAARSAAFSGDAIVVTLTNGSSLHLATTSALTGTLSVAAGTHGDSLIRFAPSGPAHALSAIVPGAAQAVPAATWAGTTRVEAAPDTWLGHLAHAS